MKPFWIALQFLTRFPTPNLNQISPQQMGRSVIYYPLVGLIIGGVLSLVALLFQGLGDALAAALVLTVWVSAHKQNSTAK